MNVFSNKVLYFDSEESWDNTYLVISNIFNNVGIIFVAKYTEASLNAIAL